MNDDLISRSALLAELNDDKYTWEDYDNVDFAVQNLPAVDAVEVVRCKYCIHRDGTPGQPNIVCYNMKDDDFCSYGERRDDRE